MFAFDTPILNGKASRQAGMNYSNMKQTFTEAASTPCTDAFKSNCLFGVFILLWTSEEETICLFIKIFQTWWWVCCHLLGRVCSESGYWTPIGFLSAGLRILDVTGVYPSGIAGLNLWQVVSTRKATKHWPSLVIELSLTNNVGTSNHYQANCLRL